MSDPIRPVAIVTGATGGVGSATVDLLLARGHDVVAVDLAPAPDRWVADERVAVVTGDVSREETADETVRVALERFGRLDVLVNNAALFLRKPLPDTTLDDLQRLLAVNVVGTFLFTKAALPALAATRGSIVNLASTSGLAGTPDQSAYSITKGAIVQFTRQSAIEHAPLGIRVNAVAPGPIDTEFVAKAVARGSRLGAPVEAIRAANPLGRISTAEEIAEAIVWIAGSPAATGTILSVDGGHTAQ
ncbi:SDR family NAD(P)-dependent oxidoreductase [Herbiconiux sp. UC225_62]|uniref:SDR family NAD(P)-dependent oxidoreductase n=1 Tax=Herbiconiux sp. UC225_62 TaxID=3350168 RepID=UPI0036D2A4DE